MKINVKRMLFGLVLPVIIILLKPAILTFEQTIVLATLVMTITFWVNNAIHKSITSVIALVLFYAFGHPPVLKLLQFPLSENFLLIVFSFVFSQGIANTGLAEVIIEPLIIKYAKSGITLLGVIMGLALIMIFVIPQPFSRVIILSHIFYQYYKKMSLSKQTQSILMFAVFLFSMFVNMTLIRGDIILNNALIGMSGLTVSEGTWIKYMTLPTLLFSIVGLFTFCLVFKNALGEYKQAVNTIVHKATMKLTNGQKRELIIILMMLLAWATEDLHGFSGTYTVILSTLIMFLLKMLTSKDFKSVNIHLLIFLTAAFSIGPVMTYSGLALAIFSKFIPIFPNTYSTYYALIVILVTVFLHMLLGSNVTTMSVVIPGLMTISEGIVDPVNIMFLIFIAICGHFVLPFHNVILLLGNGSGYYDNSPVIKYGIILLPIMLFFGLFIFLPWWQWLV
ncbi:SLC13 family permease [Fusibacter ferrireducens]|uniref:Anion permease n=1 Tax=Fusibacter ferrireducens TaxID=2785058 RepID=A0ABR9ZWA4_9FIRM|nr:anion permease [Fusibacter ferrireducens]MBF4694747.1 anion permease [Fusibacter ferrireducens]